MSQGTIITLGSSPARMGYSKAILESYGFRVVAATTLRGVISAAKACHPEMVLIGKSIGREIAHAVASKLTTPHVRVVQMHDGPPDLGFLFPGNLP